jgi:transposase
MNNKENRGRGRRKYDEEFKEGAVKMVEAGQSVRAVAESLGVRVEHVYRWKAAKQAGASDAEREVLELRAKYRQLEQERDILKKALSIFSRGG